MLVEWEQIGIGTGVILFIAGGIGLVIGLFPPLLVQMETIEVIATTEEQLPLNKNWVELPARSYRMTIEVGFNCYRTSFGYRMPSGYHGQSFTNISISTSSNTIKSFSWGDIGTNGNSTFNFSLDKAENLTLSCSFIVSDYDVEFEAIWYLTVTETDFVKGIFTFLRDKAGSFIFSRL